MRVPNLIPLDWSEDEYEDFITASIRRSYTSTVLYGDSPVLHREGLYQAEDSFPDCPGWYPEKRERLGVPPDKCVCGGGYRMPIGFWDRATDEEIDAAFAPTFEEIQEQRGEGWDDSY